MTTHFQRQSQRCLISVNKFISKKKHYLPFRVQSTAPLHRLPVISLSHSPATSSVSQVVETLQTCLCCEDCVCVSAGFNKQGYQKGFKLKFNIVFQRKMATRFNKTLDDVLYPSLETSKTGMLKVSDLHTVYWEESGKSDGLPVMVLHGGPGGGSQDEYRRYFDPSQYRIIQMDQRGCGKSTPHAELKDNNTQALVGDIEKLRQFLGIDTWFVFGGSWGSTLSLTYAIYHPDRLGIGFLFNCSNLFLFQG